MDKKQRLNKAIESENHATEIPALAKIFQDEGMKQLEMYLLFEGFFKQCDPNDLRYDSLADTMDAIVGGAWAKGRDLYPNELTNEKIEKSRTPRLNS